MRLTSLQINEAFIGPGWKMLNFSTAWVLIGRAQREDGLELREALYIVRRQHDEVAVFVEKILHESDLNDVIYVIDHLVSESKNPGFDGVVSLRMLHAWRAVTLMHIVLAKRIAVQAFFRKNLETAG